MRLIPIGCNNFVSSDKILTIVSPEAAPVRRMISSAKENGRLIDATCGRKTKSVLVSTSDHVVLSSVSIEILAKKFDSEVNLEEEI